MQNVPSKGAFYLVAAALLALLVLTYSNHFNNPFQFDDDHTIVTNQYIRDIHNIPHFFTDAKTFSSLPANQAYRPGVTTLNAIDFWLGGKDFPVPFYFHLSIFISYVLLGVLLFFFFRALFNKAREHPWNDWFALFAAAFFCLHTANAETINYIISRSDSFSTLMIVLAFVIYMGRPAWRKWFIYLLPVIAGFFVKEPTVMILPLLILYDLLFEQDTSLAGIFTGAGIGKAFRSLLRFIPLLLTVIILLAISSHFASDKFTPGGSSRLLYILTQPFVIIHYVNNFILPVNLSADTDWTTVNTIRDDRVLVGCAFLLLLVIIAFRTSRKKEWRPVSFGILWFLLALLPTSVVPLSEVLNDHRTFFPYIGLVLAGVWSLALLVTAYSPRILAQAGTRSIFISLCTLVLVAHAIGTHHRNKVWSSGESLWYDVTVKSPGNGRGLMNYGIALFGKNDLKGALDYYNRSLRVWPYYSYTYINRGLVQERMQLTAAAEADYKEALRLNPENPEGYNYYAWFLYHHSRNDEARTVLEKGLQLSPAHLNMVTLKKLLDNTPKTDPLAALNEAIRTASNNPTADNYLNLSLQYYLAGEYDMCIKAAEEVLKLDPKNDGAYNNICSAYNVLKQWDKAIEAGEKGLKINPNNQLLRNNLDISRKGKQGS